MPFVPLMSQLYYRILPAVLLLLPRLLLVLPLSAMLDVSCVTDWYHFARGIGHMKRDRSNHYKFCFHTFSFNMMGSILISVSCLVLSTLTLSFHHTSL